MVALTLWFLLLPVVAALYADQVNELERHVTYLGPINGVTARGAKHAVIDTGAGVVALLGVKTGETSWRRSLPDGERVTAAFSCPTGICNFD
jgi:hypothetical protein